MKRLIVALSLIIVLITAVTACSGYSRAEEESLDARIAKAESELASAEAESASIAESIAAKENRAANYEPTDEEKELIVNEWYRSVDNGKDDIDIYWLTMDEKGYCQFMHETKNTDEPIDKLEGTWTVDDHGFVQIDLGKYKGKFRFLKNSSGSTNVICIDGDDFVESGDEGAYAAFVPVKWYRGDLRFIELSTNSEEDGKTFMELKGEGDNWFQLAGNDISCKFDVSTRDAEIPCAVAINQNDKYVVKVIQVKK